MSRGKRELIAWVFVAALGLISKQVYDGRRRAEGREQVERAARIALTDSLAHSRAAMLRAYRVDTVKLWRTVGRARPLIDSLLSRTAPDTSIPAPVLTPRESVLVFVADTLIEQCRSVVSLCERRISVADSLLSVATKDRDYYRRKAQPSRLTQLSTAAKWLTAGYLLGVFIYR